MYIVDATYDSEELGWKTEPIELTGDIALEVALPEDGYVVVKQYDEDADIFRNVLVSSFCSKYKGTVFGATPKKIIQIFSSVEPELIKYEKI
jgi:hypothetical protein